MLKHLKYLIKGYVAVWICVALLAILLAVVSEGHWDKLWPYFSQLQLIGIGLYLAGGSLFHCSERRNVWCDRLSLSLCLCGGAAFITASSILYVPLLI